MAKIRSGFPNLAISGAHIWGEWLHPLHKRCGFGAMLPGPWGAWPRLQNGIWIAEVKGLFGDGILEIEVISFGPSTGGGETCGHCIFFHLPEHVSFMGCNVEY